MRLGKKPKADPTATSADPNAVNDSSSQTKTKRQMPSLRFPFDMTTFVYVLGGVIIFSTLGIIGACITAPAFVPTLVFGTMGIGVLTAILCVFGVAAGN